jgi:hypothetical protein
MIVVNVVVVVMVMRVMLVVVVVMVMRIVRVVSCRSELTVVFSTLPVKNRVHSGFVYPQYFPKYQAAAQFLCR